MKKGQLSREMQKAYDMIKEHGKLVRYNGGFWAKESSPMKPISFLEPETLVPVTFVHTKTVEALYNRGLIVISYWKNLPSGMFVTEYKIKQDEQAIEDGQTPSNS